LGGVETGYQEEAAMRTSGGIFRCVVCGQDVGSYGRYQHYNKHVREGIMEKKVANSGRWEFYVTGPNWRKAD